MGKRKSEKLKIVRMLAERKESNAATILQDQKRKLAAENAYLVQVQSYYQDYLGKIDNQAKVSAEELIRYRNFSQQLADSVQKVQKKIQHTQTSVERAQHEWMLLRHKRAAIEDLIQRALRDEQREDDSKEQKTMDELVNQKSLRDGQKQ